MRRGDLLGGRLSAVALVIALLLSACGGGDDDTAEEPTGTPTDDAVDDAADDAADAEATDEGATDEGATDEGATDEAGGAAEVTAPRVGFSAPIQPSYIVGEAGPVLFGEEFGLSVSQDDYLTFDSHSTAVQAALAGEADVVGASTMAHLAIIAQGQPFVMFAPFNNSDDFVLAGRGDVDSIEQLLDPEVTVATDDIGGAGQTIFDAMLQAQDAGFLVTDIPNPVIIGSSGGRESALASGEADATVIHQFQADRVDAETGDVNIITSLYDNVPVFQMQAFAAPQEWVDANLESAAAFAASIIQASRMLREDFDGYRDAVHELIEEPPDDETLQGIFDIIENYDLWATDGGLQQERIEFMIELGQAEGIIEEDLTYDQVVDPRPVEMALEMLDG